MTGQQDIGAGAGGAGTGRRHPGHHRHRRGKDVLHQGTHAAIQPARGVHAQDYQRGASAAGIGNGATNMVHRCRANDAIEVNDHSLAGQAFLRCGKYQQ